MSESTDRAEVCKGLHELADWYEQHPEVTANSTTLYFYPKNHGELSAVVRAMGKSLKLDLDDAGLVSKYFAGGICAEAYYAKDKCCERIQTGSRTVPEEVTPATVEVTVPEHEEPVYEWRCPPMLESGEAHDD